MRNALKAVGLVVTGFLLALFFLFTCNLQYVHVIQKVDNNYADQAQLTFSMQPFFPSPVIDLFHGTSK